ncbi:hypothetical protein Scep_011904 [Stephania cephalantha]|uniref:Xyloglucan endotransglucosylase/hydrolase n=1 Tax=Stephania cephalantha TaxID=152367 RepID=A0AAP0JFM6_9MAGN
MDAEAVAGETKWEVQEDGNGLGTRPLDLDFSQRGSISLGGLTCNSSSSGDSAGTVTAYYNAHGLKIHEWRHSFLVDNIPIREFNNAEKLGVPYPKSQPMRIYSSLWNAKDWATRGGLVKTDWTKAPFTAYYRNFNANACTGSSSTSSSSCSSSSKFGNALTENSWQTQELDAMSRRRLRWVQKNYMIYNYCSDFKRFPQGPPPECRPSRFLCINCLPFIV